MRLTSRWVLLGMGLLVLGGPRAYGEWDPQAGLWGKTKESDIRVMTWNVHDTVRTTAYKGEAIAGWAALAHIIAAFQPDVLLMQEAGDTGSGVDTVSELELTLEMLFEGGVDVFNGGVPVGAYVQAYVPDYNLPYRFVCDETDGYNRNVVCSRFPFADLNGDGVSQASDLPRLLPDEYQSGGSGIGYGGGYRGFMLGELDLPDNVYRGDFVAGTCHLKAYSEYWAERATSAKLVAYYLDYFYNGGGEGVSDPHEKILGSPATSILDGYTPVVWGGDLNEDELTNGRKGPADWMVMAEFEDPGDDGTDFDRSDSTYDEAVQPFNLADRSTYGTSTTNKLDYLLWYDSVATARVQFVFRSGSTPEGLLPAEVLSYARPTSASTHASDHRPVIVDYIVPLWGDEDGDGDLDLGDYTAFQACMTGPNGGLPGGCDWADFDSDGDVDAEDFLSFQAAFSGATS